MPRTGKRALLESDSERAHVVYDIGTKDREMRSLSKQIQQRDKASRIEENIRKRENLFKTVDPMAC